ncbi:hypothetical protein H6P81_018588 [Aristolochia fimbriata]|uniref:Uncharacterized protein n=1 Tax=Aristolochia fimbriata TaxID=158543 RepID=A0AAV7E3H2_ARIFI|nr:hypothetical protein H6P81_018588 [Aristolochia fimbriata]
MRAMVSVRGKVRGREVAGQQNCQGGRMIVRKLQKFISDFIHMRLGQSRLLETLQPLSAGKEKKNKSEINEIQIDERLLANTSTLYRHRADMPSVFLLLESYPRLVWTRIGW